MKANQIIGILALLALLMICSIFSVSQGADRFYYGTYGGRAEQDFPSMSDSLKFNIVYRHVNPSDDMEHYINYSLRTIVSNRSDEYSPAHWASYSHYTLWEAEGYPGSYYGFTYSGGREISDASASGGKAWFFDHVRDSAGTVQTGPNYNQERKRGTQDIEYTAEFRIKSPPTWEPRSAGPSQPICILKVVGNGEVLAQKVVYTSYFENFYGYKTFKIENYTAELLPIEFQIYWYGNRRLYIDYVKAYDENGWELVDQGLRDQQIMDYVSQPWVLTTLPNGDTVVYRWYLRDEPEYIDLFEPSRYIDSLLRQVSTERVGFQAFRKVWDYNLVHEYFLRQNPEEYHVDLYPTAWWGPDSSGEHFQDGLTNVLTRHLKESKEEAESRQKDFWVTIQAHYFGKWSPDSSCEDPRDYPLYVDSIPIPGWYCYYLKRPPTPNEVRLQTFLSLCYGANSILNFCYYSYNYYVPEYGDTCLMLGLYFHGYMGDSTSASWREIRDFTGPRVEKLGPVFNQLTWQGAGFHEDVDTITGSFIDSLKPAPGETLTTTYAEIGFFKDEADTDYFMLVNRRCLSTEEQNVTVYIDSAEIGNKTMWYVIDQYSQDTTFTGAINGAIPFTTHLEPGEGKLFKLTPFPDFAFHGTAHPFTWQGGIMIDGDVTVDSGKTLVILPPAKITFYANTDVMRTWDTTDCDFVVNGGLRAVGTEADSIIFTSTESNPNDWEGIQVLDSASSNAALSHCVVEYAYTGIDLKSPHPDTITHSSFHNNKMGGINWENDNEGIISNNHVFFDTALYLWNFGITLRKIRTGMSSSVVTENVITNYYEGMWIDDCSTKVSCNSISNAEYRGVSVGEQWHTSFPSYVILDNISVTGNLDDFGFYTYGNSGFLELEQCRLLPNEDNGPSIGVIFQNNAVGFNPYSMRWCDIKDFTEKGVFCLGQAVADLGTTDDKGYNEVYSDVDSAWYVYRSGKSLSPMYAQYNWWGEYPPDPNRFYGNVAYMPALEREPDRPDTLIPKVAVSGGAPKKFELLQNYPNPFNPATSIQFTVRGDQSPTHITLKIYNILGQLVRTLMDEEKAEGSYTVYWDGRTDNGKTASSGIYFYKLEAGEFTDVKKMVLLR